MAIDLSGIYNYESLVANFASLDKNGDGKISKEESPEAAALDEDRNKALELWEMMDAVNAQRRIEIFPIREINATISAYKILGSFRGRHIKKEFESAGLNRFRSVDSLKCVIEFAWDNWKEQDSIIYEKAPVQISALRSKGLAPDGIVDSIKSSVSPFKFEGIKDHASLTAYFASLDKDKDGFITTQDNPKARSLDENGSGAIELFEMMDAVNRQRGSQVFSNEDRNAAEQAYFFLWGTSWETNKWLFNSADLAGLERIGFLMRNLASLMSVAAKNEKGSYSIPQKEFWRAVCRDSLIRSGMSEDESENFLKQIAGITGEYYAEKAFATVPELLRAGCSGQSILEIFREANGVFNLDKGYLYGVLPELFVRGFGKDEIFAFLKLISERVFSEEENDWIGRGKYKSYMHADFVLLGLPRNLDSFKKYGISNGQMMGLLMAVPDFAGAATDEAYSALPGLISRGFSSDEAMKLLRVLALASEGGAAGAYSELNVMIDSLKKAGLNNTEMSELLIGVAGTAKTHSREAYEALGEVSLALKPLGVSEMGLLSFIAQISVAVADGYSLRNAYKALPALLKSGLSADEVVDLYRLIGQKKEELYKSYAYDRLPEAVTSLGSLGLNKYETINLLKTVILAVEKRPDLAIEVLPELMKLGLDKEKAVGLLKGTDDMTSPYYDAYDAFGALPNLQKAKLSNEEMLSLIKLVCDSGGRKILEGFKAQPEMLLEDILRMSKISTAPEALKFIESAEEKKTLEDLSLLIRGKNPPQSFIGPKTFLQVLLLSQCQDIIDVHLILCTGSREKFGEEVKSPFRGFMLAFKTTGGSWSVVDDDGMLPKRHLSMSMDLQKLLNELESASPLYNFYSVSTKDFLPVFNGCFVCNQGMIDQVRLKLDGFKLDLEKQRSKYLGSMTSDFKIGVLKDRKSMDKMLSFAEACSDLPETHFSGIKTVDFRQGSWTKCGNSPDYACYFSETKEIILPYSGVEPAVHEIIHYWDEDVAKGSNGTDLGAGDPSLIFYKISWANYRIELDGWRKRKGADKSDFADEYGMTNGHEDIATSGEFYYDGASFREMARREMATGNFEPAAKYLFNKYVRSFDPRDGLCFEYNLREDSLPLSVKEVRGALDKWLSAHPGTVATTTIEAIDEIEAYYLKQHKRFE